MFSHFLLQLYTAKFNVNFYGWKVCTEQKIFRVNNKFRLDKCDHEEELKKSWLIQIQHFLISLILIFTSEIGPFWLEIVGYQINVLSRLGQKRNLSQWDFKNIWILVVTDKE